MKPVIEARNLNKSFREGSLALSGLDLTVACGSVYGLIGRNGAGKTTAMRCLMGLLRPDSGTARILGADFWTAPRQRRQQVGYVSQSQRLPGWMSLRDFCRYVSQFYERWDEGLAEHLTSLWDVPRTRPISELSWGEQRMVSILTTMASRPRVLLLDEPAAGLDPIARRSLLSNLIELMNHDARCTILLSSHLIQDLERVADTIGIMDRGRIIRSVCLQELLETTKRVQVVFDRDEPPPGFSIPGAQRSETAGPVVTAIVNLANDQQLDPVRRLPGTRVQIFPLGLEEIFIQLQGSQTKGTWPDEKIKAPPLQEPVSWKN